MNRNNALRSKALEIWGWMAETGVPRKRAALEAIGYEVTGITVCPACEYAVERETPGSHMCSHCPVDGWRSDTRTYLCGEGKNSPYKEFISNRSISMSKNKPLAEKVHDYIKENWKETPEEN